MLHMAECTPRPLSLFMCSFPVCRGLAKSDGCVAGKALPSGGCAREEKNPLPSQHTGRVADDRVGWACVVSVALRGAGPAATCWHCTRRRRASTRQRCSSGPPSSAHSRTPPTTHNPPPPPTPPLPPSPRAACRVLQVRCLCQVWGRGKRASARHSSPRVVPCAWPAPPPPHAPHCVHATTSPLPHVPRASGTCFTSTTTTTRTGGCATRTCPSSSSSRASSRRHTGPRVHLPRRDEHPPPASPATAQAVGRRRARGGGPAGKAGAGTTRAGRPIYFHLASSD